MGKKTKSVCYAYTVEGEAGIVATWAECEALTRGKPARYKGFPTRDEAEAWLASGARYEDRSRAKKKARENLPADGVYFDAGTGRGHGTEVRVTDRDGVPLTFMAVDESRVTKEGNVLLSGRTNNYGELTAMAYALRIALKLGKKEVLGDSKLVIDYWSRGFVSSKVRSTDPDLCVLVEEVKKLRRDFEGAGGRITHISGDVNPADLGFHK